MDSCCIMKCILINIPGLNVMRMLKKSNKDSPFTLVSQVKGPSHIAEIVTNL